MDDLARKLGALRDEIDPRWSDARRACALRGVERLMRRSRIKRGVSASLGALALLGLMAWRALDAAQTQPRTPAPHSLFDTTNSTPAIVGVSREPLPAGMPVHLADGSLAMATTADTRLNDESRWFEQTPDDVRAAVPARREVTRDHLSPRRKRAQIEWRTLHQSGDYERAYALIEAGAPVDDDAEVLMEAADAARLTGHVRAAARYLRKVVTDHPTDPATPLAAFTLGRVLLDHLGRPFEAAEAFSTARELAQDGSLAQDCLAREVEAWSKAGQADEAYVHARMFMERYPDSRRRRVVQLYGGLATE